ncbi:MAG: protein jag [Lachnospiraceae bacterium]|jgi:spoIIIJ-associated protein|nr:protein jag [Lachnospiraceae bacterium]MCI9601895.1 protein jag [Lachnospiraceae bacterium]
MEYREFSAKTLDDAITDAKVKLEATTENFEYEVIDKGSSGFLGIGSRPAKIRARKILNAREKAEEFLERVFDAMQISVNVNIVENMDEKVMNIDLSGDDMGVLIGKRGQTLDSLQYLVSLVVNKDGEEYVRVKVDTENYRQRRKDTLENLAKNISFKVKRTGRTVTLEPMNPYERRVIHSALQNDKFVETHSEGEEPFRRVVVALKEGVKVRENNNNHRRRYSNNRNYNRNHSKKGGGRE